jgi:hypothetical protein
VEISSHEDEQKENGHMPQIDNYKLCSMEKKILEEVIEI